MLNYMLIKQKKIFKCFNCFGKYFGLKNVENFKNCAALFQRLASQVKPIACPNSELTQKVSATHWQVKVPVAKQSFQNFFFKNLVFQISCDSIWRLVREWKLQSQVLLRTFGDSCRDSLVSGTSCRKKHFKTNFKILSHGFLATCFGNLFATQYSREKRVFCTLIVFFKTILKTFQFSLTHCDCSLSCPFISLTNSLCFSQKSTIFFIISSSNFKERYGVFIFLKVFHIYSL